MKQLKLTLIIIISLLTGISIHAQNIITGSNLNIGSGNGFVTDVNDTYGNAIGTQNYVGGANTLVIGYSDTVSLGSTNSFVAGAHNRINGINSFAIGGFVKANGNTSMGLGYYLKPENENNIVIGVGIKGNNDISSKYLQNSYESTLMIGFHSTKPTLTVGPSPNDYPQGDTIGKTGKVAIGDVPVPDIAAKLHIRSDYGEDAGIILEPKDPTTENTYIKMRDEKHRIEVDKDGVMILNSFTTNINNGSDVKQPLILRGIVGVNIDPYRYDDLTDTYGLWVTGGILTDRIIIKRQADWFDHVFNPGYELMPLRQLKKYVYENRHLPDIPSEKEVIDNGVEVYEMQSLLLKKIEELTLYTIQLQEQIESMQAEINTLKNK